ncbi:MAG: hypothetical protein GMKNLPBB_00160 [Myxococcota bacterium]|nr:hypothetical protein [Myxococcota bacterium]
MIAMLQSAWVICRRELAGYVNTLTFWVMAAVFLFFSGSLFVTILQRWSMDQVDLYRSGSLLDDTNLMTGVFVPWMDGAARMLLFVLPLLTMRLIAEEKRNRTWELLLTSPASTFAIAAGKFMSIAVVVAVLCGLTFIFPALTGVFMAQGSGDAVVQGSLDWLTIASGFTGLFLMGCALAAMGLFWSSLSDNLVVSALLSFSGALLVAILPAIAAAASGVWKTLLEHAALTPHIANFARGYVSTATLVYYLTFTLFFLLLTVRVIDAQRWE